MHGKIKSDTNKKSRFPRPSLLLSPALYSSILLIIITLAAYWNTLSNGFIWDDNSLIVENPAIRNLNLTTLINFFIDKNVYQAVGEIYRPLTILSYALNYSISGLDPFGFHLTNLIIHTINSILVLFLLTRIFKDRQTALIAAILFATHPIHTEAVDWLKDRDDLLATLFFILSLYLYISSKAWDRLKELKRGKERIAENFVINTGKRNILLYSLALLFYAFALLSKEMAITLPFIVILYDICFSTISLKKIKYWIIYLPFFTLSILYFTLRTIILGQIAQTEYMGGSFLITIYTMLNGILHYIQLLILPFKLCADYLNFPISRGLDTFPLLILIVILLIGILSYKRSKITTFSIFWFFITLLPVYNIIPIKIPIAERFLYIPSIGFIILLSAAFKYLWMNIPGSFSKTVLTILLLSIILFYTITTFERNKAWKDDLSLWSASIKTCHGSRVYENLGAALTDKGKLDKALNAFTTAISLGGNNSPVTHYYLGQIYTRQNLFNKAEKELKSAWILAEKGFYSGRFNAISTKKFKSDIKNGTGILYMEKGILEKALAQLLDAVKIKPDNYEAYYNLGLVYMKQNRFEKAIDAFKHALSINDRTSKIYRKLGIAYYRIGMEDKALRASRKALQLMNNH